MPYRYIDFKDVDSWGFFSVPATGEVSMKYSVPNFNNAFAQCLSNCMQCDFLVVAATPKSIMYIVYMPYASNAII